MCYLLRWKGASVTVLCKTDSTWHTMVNSKWSEKWPGPNVGTSRNSRTVSSETVVISDEGYAKLRDQVTIKRRRWEPLTYSHFLYSLRLIIWQDGKKPGLIDWTQRFWEISCSVCFLQVMRLIREGGIIMNSLGSFPAPGAKVAAAKIFLGKYNRGLVPMSIHSSFALSEPIFVNLIEIWDARQLEMRMSDRCAGIKNPSDFFPICQRSLPIQEWHKMWSRFAPQICHFFGS